MAIIMTFQVLKICEFVVGCIFSSLHAKTSQGLTNMGSSQNWNLLVVCADRIFSQHQQ